MNNRHIFSFRAYINAKECDVMLTMTNARPIATATIRGSKEYETIRGKVDMYDTYGGTILIVEVYGIPREIEESSAGFLGFHLHSGGSCTGTTGEPFANVEGHYNPEGTEHPRHAGDLPPLLVNNGNAWMSVYTKRFYPENVIGRTIIIHAQPDDFRTQPSGNSGPMIACGEVVGTEYF